MHLTSFTEPRHPKNDTIQTAAPVATSVYATPMNRLFPKSSVTNALSTTVQIPNPKTIAPPI